MISVSTGEQIDHYRLESVVANGGMACIYRATDLQTGRVVAIKIPHFEAESDPVLFDRFQREEEIGTALDHPAVMKVLPKGERSRLYMVMEWVEGRVLREMLLEEGRLSPDRAVQITLRICEALEYIHAHGITHRDLKPENVMVDTEDHVKLIDFGIAAKSGARRLTFGSFSKKSGTPDYVSPEQVKGKRGDARSDVYALGTMLYEMLTGETPFPGADPFLVLNSKLLNHPVPPRELNPGITPELQEIMYRALERDPKNRYATAREMAWDLEHPGEVSVPAERPELQEWTFQRKPWKRRALFYSFVALIPLTLFALLFYIAAHGF